MKISYTPNPVPIGENPKWITVYFKLPDGTISCTSAHAPECLIGITPICGVWPFGQGFDVSFPTVAITPPDADGVCFDTYEWVLRQIDKYFQP